MTSMHSRVGGARGHMHRRRMLTAALAGVVYVLLTGASAAQALTEAEKAAIDKSAVDTIGATGAPSVSIAIVRGGELVYEQAYGDGRIDPPTPANSSMRYAIGSISKQFTATKEATGWLFGVGQLAMTARDLALWDIAVMNRAVLQPASYTTQQTDVLLTAGNASGYGLGVNVSASGGRRRIAHGGAVSGYTSTNLIYPDDRAAIVVFTNIYPGAANAPGRIAERIASIVFAPGATDSTQAREAARGIYDGLARGTIDRGLFTPAANAYFTPEVLSDYASSLGVLGSPSEFASTGESLRGGMTIRSYRIRAGAVGMALTVMTLPDGRIDQYIVSRAD